MVARSRGSVFPTGLVLHERYRLDELRSSGGTAEVWRGHDLVLQRPVAIKLLHPHLADDPSIIERFRREAVTAARLSHPHIVPTYDTGSDQHATYIVLGLIHGPTLAEILETKRMTPREALSVTRQVAGALDHAHKAGLIHRDIKPSNIVVVDDIHRVMVADFGIARALSSTELAATMPGLILDTPAYLAPEQRTGQEADARTDVYAVGVLLHEMLCDNSDFVDGAAWFEGSNVFQDNSGMLDHHESCENLPLEIRQIVEQATRTAPADRYESAGALQEAVTAAERRLVGATANKVTNWDNKARIHPMTRHVLPSTQAETSTTCDTARHASVPAIPAITDPPVDSLRYQPSPQRRTMPMIIAALGFLAVGSCAAYFIRQPSRSHETPPAAATPITTTAPITIVTANAFDPFGDNQENNAQAASVATGGPWSTETYTNRHFGNLKGGVGIVLQLANTSKLTRLDLDTTAVDWAGSVYVGSAPKNTLEDWGQPVANQVAAGTHVSIDLHGAPGAAVLIWITDLGAANRVTITGFHLFP